MCPFIEETEDGEEEICPVIGSEPVHYEPKDIFFVTVAATCPWTRSSHNVGDGDAKEGGGGDLYLESGTQQNACAKLSPIVTITVSA